LRRRTADNGRTSTTNSRRGRTRKFGGWRFFTKNFFKARERVSRRKRAAASVNYISPKDFINCRKEKVRGGVKRNSKMVFLKNQGCNGYVTGCYPVNR